MSSKFDITPPQPGGLIDRPSAWIGSDMLANPERWFIRLSEADINELEAATRFFLDSGLPLGDISPQSFPLVEFGRRLRQLRDELIDGVGVQVLRGLPVSAYSAEFSATLFCGMGVWLGSLRSQNAAGHLLGHVRNIGADASDTNTRIYQTSERQTFHTDSADVVGLLCLQDAQQGGLSQVVSAETIFNRMWQQRPELAALLFNPIATDRRGEVPPGEKPYFDIPVFSWFDNRLTVMYQRQYIESAQRFDDVPALSQQQIEALDLFDQLANDPELHFSMQMQPGDLQFVYNHALLHDRTGFIDWPEVERRRHLYRLWLSVPGDRALPECFRQRFGSIEIGNRGGIITEATRLQMVY